MFISFLCVTAQLKKRKKKKKSNHLLPFLWLLIQPQTSEISGKARRRRRLRLRRAAAPLPSPIPALVPLLHSWETAPALPQRLLT